MATALGINGQGKKLTGCFGAGHEKNNTPKAGKKKKWGKSWEVDCQEHETGERQDRAAFDGDGILGKSYRKMEWDKPLWSRHTGVLKVVWNSLEGTGRGMI